MNNASSRRDRTISIEPLPQKKSASCRGFFCSTVENITGRARLRMRECDYVLWECAETGLQFLAHDSGRPMFLRMGQWVCLLLPWHPVGIRRSESQIKAKIASLQKVQVLDVGCGKGDFLKGLDLSRRKSSPWISTSRGRSMSPARISCYCGTWMRPGSRIYRAREFPIVTSFHCLEHVDQPVAFVRSLLQAVAPGGRLVHQQPYSPMSFEADWFDILNILRPHDPLESGRLPTPR